MPVRPVNFNLLVLRLKYAMPPTALIEVSPPSTAPLAPVAVTSIVAVLLATRLPEMSRTRIAGWLAKAIRLAAMSEAPEAMLSWVAAPKVMVTPTDSSTVFGLEIEAFRCRRPSSSVSLIPLPTKSATPATASMYRVPPMVASGLERVTRWVE